MGLLGLQPTEARTRMKLMGSSSISSANKKVQRLGKGYEVPGIDTFDEGELPRKLLLGALRKGK